MRVYVDSSKLSASYGVSDPLWFDKEAKQFWWTLNKPATGFKKYSQARTAVKNARKNGSGGTFMIRGVEISE